MKSNAAPGENVSDLSSDDLSRITSAPGGTDLVDLMDRVRSRVRDNPPVPHNGPPKDLEDVDPLGSARRQVNGDAVTTHIGWQTPVVGPFLARLRTLFFNDARAYVDAHLARQAEIDRTLIGTIDDLRREIAELKATIERIQRGDE